jgi:hypothetical protein
MLFSFSSAFCQESYTFLDALSNAPVANVTVVDPAGRLVALSNIHDTIEIPKMTSGSYSAKHPGYEMMTINKDQGTRVLYMEAVGSELEEVVISGMTNEQLYAAIVARSQSKASVLNGKGRMSYYGSTYSIQKNRQGIMDTLVADTYVQFRFNTVVSSKGKRTYTFYADSAIRSVIPFKEQRPSDEEYAAGGSFHRLAAIDRSLGLDLSNAKRFV